MAYRLHPCKVLDLDGERIEIDQEIVPLIERVWSLDLDTYLSCQDNNGFVWVDFDARCAQRFLQLVARDEGLRVKVLGRVPAEHAWLYRTDPEWIDQDDTVVFFTSVRFPRSDLPAVMAALERVELADCFWSEDD